MLPWSQLYPRCVLLRLLVLEVTAVVLLVFSLVLVPVLVLVLVLVSMRIGEAGFEHRMVSAICHDDSVQLFETTLCEKDELMILACDGLFDVMSSQQVRHR